MSDSVIQTNHTIDSRVEIKICSISGKEFPITQGDLDFYDKISPTFAGKKIPIPTPILCPKERQRRRLAFRNERNLYRRTCDASGKQIISIYSPDKPYKVYDQKIRRSDNRDAMSYGREFDFTKSFTENFGDLIKEVPRLGIINDNGITSINSEYCNDSVGAKNSYMCFEMGECEDCMYSHHSNGAKNIIDCDEASSCEYCYEVIDSMHTYGSLQSQGLFHCNSCSYSTVLTSCDHCILCSGLTNASYYYKNKKVTPVEYDDIINKIRTDRAFREEMLREYHTLITSHQHNLIFSSENCEGFNIMDSNNLYNCRNCFHSNSVKNGLSLYQVNDCMDIQCRKSTLCYEGQTLDESYNSCFCSWSSRGKYMYYCDSCHDCTNIFGCIGLRNKSYCIFNKQYTKEEYELTASKIVSHMIETGERGEFFHPSLSPFGYNETVAMEYYHIDRANLLDLPNNENAKSISLQQWGYKRSDYESPKPVSDKVIQGKDLPHSIEEVQDDILHYAISCEITGKLFRIQPQELAFYRKRNIPLPRKHPDQRHLERLALRK